MTKRKFENEGNKESLNYKKTKNDEITIINLKGINDKDKNSLEQISYKKELTLDASNCFGAHNSQIKKNLLNKLINSDVEKITFQNNFFTDFSSKFLFPLLGKVLSDKNCKIKEIKIIDNEISGSALNIFSENLEKKSLQKIYFKEIKKCTTHAIDILTKICEENKIEFINDDLEINKDNSIKDITNQEDNFNFFNQTYSSEKYLLWQEKQGIKYDWGNKNEENNRPTTGGKSPSYTEKLKKKHGVHPYSKMIEKERKEENNNIEL
jgi:hypothetical protein